LRDALVRRVDLLGSDADFLRRIFAARNHGLAVEQRGDSARLDIQREGQLVRLVPAERVLQLLEALDHTVVVTCPERDLRLLL